MEKFSVHPGETIDPRRQKDRGYSEGDCEKNMDIADAERRTDSGSEPHGEVFDACILGSFVCEPE